MQYRDARVRWWRSRWRSESHHECGQPSSATAGRTAAGAVRLGLSAEPASGPGTGGISSDRLGLVESGAVLRRCVTGSATPVQKAGSPLWSPQPLQPGTGPVGGGRYLGASGGLMLVRSSAAPLHPVLVSRSYGEDSAPRAARRSIRDTLTGSKLGMARFEVRAAATWKACRHLLCRNSRTPRSRVASCCCVARLSRRTSRAPGSGLSTRRPAGRRAGSSPSRRATSTPRA